MSVAFLIFGQQAWVLAMIVVVKVDAHVSCSFIVYLQLSDGTLFWCIMCSEILVDIWGQLGRCIPCHMSRDLICLCLVMALAWLLPPALTQEVITSVARLVSLSSTVVVTILEETVLL
jgi:hypothetical protein